MPEKEPEPVILSWKYSLLLVGTVCLSISLCALSKSPPPVTSAVGESESKLSKSKSKTDEAAAGRSGGEYTSIVRMKNWLVVNEQSLVKEMSRLLKKYNDNDQDQKDQSDSDLKLDFRQRETWRRAMSKMTIYLKDYDSSIRPMLLKSMKPVDPQGFFQWPIRVPSAKRYLDALKETVVSHPLIAFRMIRRMLIDLPDILKYDVGGRLQRLMQISELTWPPLSEDDLIGASEGILRLQKTFLISPYDFVKGTLQNYETKSGLTALDCYRIGGYALTEVKDPAASIEWHLQALRMFLKQNANDVTIQKARKGLLKAIKTHNQAIASEYGFEAVTLSEKVDQNLAKLTRENEMELLTNLPPHRPPSPYALFVPEYSEHDATAFLTLCRGETSRNEIMTKNLKCFYKKDNSFLAVKPLKVEVHSEIPLVVQFYEILPDYIIEHFKLKTTSELRRALVLSENKDDVGGTTPSKIRISTNAWIREETDDILKKIPEFIHEATGLNMKPESAHEEAQISVYGAIGGFYAAHYDTVYDPRYALYQNLSDEMISEEDRIATVMFYLSDVKIGGGTAFPKIGVVSEAIRGSAMFWFNLKQNGNKDDLTLHGGCPVLLGEKWVVNKWIHGGEQMFKFQCPLDPNL